MRVVVVYKDDTDYSRTVTDYLRDFQTQTGRELETMNPEDPINDQFVRAYDIVEYPTVIAVSDEGVMQNVWRGLPLPTISEVSYYN